MGLITLKVIISILVGGFLGFTVRNGFESLKISSRIISCGIIILIGCLAYINTWWWGIPFILISILSMLHKDDSFERKKEYVDDTISKLDQEAFKNWERKHYKYLYKKLKTIQKEHPEDWQSRFRNVYENHRIRGIFNR